MTAGVLRRFGAMLYDFLIVVALAVVVTLLFFPFTQKGITPQESGAVEYVYRAALLLVIVLFYCVFWTWRGQTLGMLAWRLRVERMDGAFLRWRDALIRLVGAWVSFAALGLGYFWIWFERDGRAWHDRWSGTRVVVVPRKQ